MNPEEIRLEALETRDILLHRLQAALAVESKITEEGRALKEARNWIERAESANLEAYERIKIALQGATYDLDSFMDKHRDDPKEA